MNRQGVVSARWDFQQARCQQKVQPGRTQVGDECRTRYLEQKYRNLKQFVAQGTLKVFAGLPTVDGPFSGPKAEGTSSGT